MKAMIPIERIEQRIFIIRSEKVMLDRHLAELYGVKTKELNRAVKRNRTRFPVDFMMQLTGPEWKILKCQFGASRWGGDRRNPPYVFTEQGVAMLSSVLHSQRAVQVNIEIMRAFVKLRTMIASHKDLARRLDELEKKYDGRFKLVFAAIRELTAEPDEPKRDIGFRP